MDSFVKKPTDNQKNKQLFSFDVTTLGAKNFFFNTYENIYQIIKHQKNPNFYEDNTYATSIKLFIDFDEKIIFNNQLERDKYAEIVTETILTQVNSKIKNTFGIDNPSVIILMSDTLLKMSLHFVYTDIIFNNIYEMKYFMHDILLIDQSVYKIGCFRMMLCSKIGKQNALLYNNSINYTKPVNEYQLFLDSCICYTENKTTLTVTIPQNTSIIKIPNSFKSTTSNISRKYTYRNVNFDIIKSTLDKLKDYSHRYNEWLTISFCLKDLYLGVTEQEKVYNLFDDFSKNSSSYNKTANEHIFLKLEPYIDINYLFKLSNESHYILPFYNYQKILFNPKNHKNIIIKNEKYIDVDTQQLLKYRYICIKSPTGTGKTTSLKQIISATGINNIISITSRVNLAGEHMKNLNLSFYLDMKTPADFENCNRLVIQLESLRKCNYKLFKNSIVILDEVNSLLSHLRSPTMNNKRREVYLYLIELIKNASYVISMDCDFSDWNIKFLQEIRNENENDYIIYYNTVKNKIGTTAIIYDYPQTMINVMIENLKNGKYFISCFDSLKQMNNIIDFLSKYGKKEEWLIYSSEIDYKLIDTKTWINRYVFFSPTILYGLDYNYTKVDVFSFTYKNHLNPLQIYQMISRARDQEKVHIYCNEHHRYAKYKSVEDVIHETELYEKNFGTLLPLYKNYIDIDDKPYRTMFYNYTFMDSILKTNIRSYLIDILINKGYNISYNHISNEDTLSKQSFTMKNIKERICSMLCLDKDNLSDLERNIVTNDKTLEKHFNLRLLLNDNIDDKLVQSITQNLFIETLKNKNIKIKICMELMNLLEIHYLKSLNKSITNNFTKNLDSVWLTNNITTIKKIFDIRTNKYDTFTYYNIYMLLITILKSLFDNNLFIRREIQKQKCKYFWYELNEKIYLEHIQLINKFDSLEFI
jgi:hypothetical protein